MRIGPRPRPARLRGRPSIASTAIALVLVLLGLAACGRDGTAVQAPTAVVVGFIYVGDVDDHGYNQAAFEGSLAIRRAFPEVRLIQRQNVPEAPAAESVMQRMIDDGATIVFATSFGHLDAALKVAARNPHVTFLHQGGLQTAGNLGTYFASIWQAQYAAGQAAGLATRTDRLGFVGAFPIAQSLLSVNAFQLGARSVNQRARTRVIYTSSWCAPAAQRRAAARLLSWRADVLAQHQDCTEGVITAAAGAGALAVGYHHDARTLAPATWLTGARWDWREVFVDIVRTIRTGRFRTSPYSGRYRLGIESGAVGLSSFGPAATPAIRSTVMRTLRRLQAGTLQPFRGPIRDRDGRLRIRGEQPSVTELEEMDYLVEGVSGTFPRS